MDIKDILKQLTNEKKLIVEEIQEKNTRLEEIDITIKNLHKVINDIQVICPECNGAGQRFSRSCAEDEGEYKTCFKCHGNGKIGIVN